MSHATLEHVNYSTPDPAKTAAWMAEVFGWKIRWQGPALETGFTCTLAMTLDILRFTGPAKI